MTEQQLNVGAILLELGSLVVISIVWLRMPKLRPHLVVILGALTPLLVTYAYMALGNVFDPSIDTAWAFDAMWIMTFWPYVACLILGVVLSLLKAVSASRTAISRRPCCTNECLAPPAERGVARMPTPNPSIERTSAGKPAPSAHVKR